MPANEHEKQQGLQNEIIKLKAQKQALVQEFTNPDSPTLDPEQTPEAIKLKVIELVPDALGQLALLLNHASSDATRAAIAKYVVDVALGKKKMEDHSESAVDKLLQELTGAKSED